MRRPSAGRPTERTVNERTALGQRERGGDTRLSRRLGRVLFVSLPFSATAFFIQMKRGEERMSFSTSRPPSVAAVQWLCAVAVTVLLPHPVVLCLSVVGAFAFGRLLGCSTRFLWMLLPFAAAIALTNPLFSHEGATVLCVIGRIPYTLEALAYGVNAAVMLSAVMLWCHAYAAVLTADRLMMLGRRLPRLTLTLCMARRWVPLFARRLSEVRRARRSLGLLHGKGRLRQEADILGAVIAWTPEQAILTARSMEARGYALKGKTAYTPYRYRLGDAVTVAVTVAALVAAALLCETFTWYPTIQAVGMTLTDTAAYAAAGVLLLAPSVWEGKERRRWQSCRSAI